MGKGLLIAMVVAAVVFGGLYLFNSLTKGKSPYPDLSPNNKTQSQSDLNSLTPSPMPLQARETPQPTPMNLTTLTRISAKTGTIHTAKGDIVIEFYPDDAPKTVMNFATLAKAGYYNGLTFHRVEPGFVIQGGDPNGNGSGGESIYGPTFEDELNASSSSYQAGYLEGVVAMANRGPNTNGSQFFIMLADTPSLPKAYTIFGKVTSGMDVVKKIAVGDKMLQVSVE